jgi:uncharacterized protein YgiM (DUF1202 family)
MKSLFRLLVLVILLTLIIAPLSAQSTTYIYPRFDSLNVRSGPGLEYGVITEIWGQLNYFPVIGQSPTGNWLLIDLGNAQGWVHQAYVIETRLTVITNTVPTTNVGQGGGYVVPTTTTTTTGTYGVYYPPVTTTTANLGQGGGFAAPTTTTALAFTPDGSFNTTVGSWVSLNLRRGPGMEYGIVAIMPQGDRATPLGRNARGTWYFVDYNGVQGWVTHTLVAFPPSINATQLPVVSNL